MARKKVKLAWIANDSARKATFKKRRKGLMKKASELSILCDVKACAIVYGPQELHPEVWPSPQEALSTLARFKSMPEMEKSKKMMNQEGFLRQRIGKLQEQLQKQEKENRELETTLLMYQGLSGRSPHVMSIEDVTCLAWLVEMKAKAVQERIDLAKGMASRMMAAGRTEEERRIAERPTSAPAMAKEVKSAFEADLEELQRQEWLMNMMNTASTSVTAAETMACGGGGEVVLHPYVDHDPFWVDPFFGC